MTKRLHPRLALLSLLLATCAGASDPPAGTDAVRIADRLLEALGDANGVPGMGAAVVLDGKTLWTGSTGMRDAEQGMPVERDTVFRLASVSKAITATAAARLQEQGLLDVDAPVQSMLPWLQAPWTPITSRQLAAHLSGLPHYQPRDAARGGVHYPTVRDAVGVFSDRELLAPPGAAYRYSSWGYTLLSAVVEARARMPFLDYLAREVTPGLAIGADATDGNDPRVSRAYEFVEGRAHRATPHDFSYTWAGGGLAATPEALARFGARVLAGSVVAPATLEWMQQPTRLADGTPARERDYEVGFGWRVARDSDGARIAHHAGVTVGARSALVLWPEHGLAASLLSNASWVSSIEQTTMMLAAPFTTVAATTQGERVACPLQASSYEGMFDGKAFAGSVRFALEAGMCVGRLSLPADPLGDWLNAPAQKNATSLQVIGMDARGGLARAALVTPMGLHDLRIEGGSRRYTASLAATRTVSLQFR